MESLSKIAEAYGRRVDNWMRLKSVQELIASTENSLGRKAVFATNGRLSREVKEILIGSGVSDPTQGTYAVKEIADAFRDWCQKNVKPEPSHVYFIRGDKTNSFKVGISSDPRARLKSLQVGSPVKLLLTRSVEVENPKNIEAELHKAFAKCKIHGEWFSMPWKEALVVFDATLSSSTER